MLKGVGLNCNDSLYMPDKNFAYPFVLITISQYTYMYSIEYYYKKMIVRL